MKKRTLGFLFLTLARTQWAIGSLRTVGECRRSSPDANNLRAASGFELK
jgi:hypothetical protein